MFSVGDIVTQKSFQTSIMSDFIKQELNMGLVGIILEIHVEVNLTNDKIFHNMAIVRWSNGTVEKLPEIYLEKIEDNS